MVNSLEDESESYTGEIQDVVRHFQVVFGWFTQFGFGFEKLVLEQFRKEIQ